jgi:DNA-binding CsgD family transcriptional regulator
MTRRRELGLSIWSRTMLWEPDVLRRSEYFNDFAVPNRLHSAVGLTVDIDATTRVGLSFLHERAVDEEITTRQLALLGLVYASFKAAVLANISLSAYRARLAHVMDSIAQGLLICDYAGRMLHRNPEMKRLLEQEPERDLIAAEMRQIVLSVAQLARRRPDGTAAVAGWPTAREVRTASAVYSLRASSVGPSMTGVDGGILIALERLTPEMPPGEVLGERYALTPREIDVTYLLLHGKSNADIAQALAISEHTARHHTESVLAKLGLHSRTEIARLFRRERGSHAGSWHGLLAANGIGPTGVSRRSGEWLQPLEVAFGFGRASPPPAGPPPRSD